VLVSGSAGQGQVAARGGSRRRGPGDPFGERGRVGVPLTPWAPGAAIGRYAVSSATPPVGLVGLIKGFSRKRQRGPPVSEVDNRALVVPPRARGRFDW
jgi:hypothetical protein